MIIILRPSLTEALKAVSSAVFPHVLGGVRQVTVLDRVQVTLGVHVAARRAW